MVPPLSINTLRLSLRAAIAAAIATKIAELLHLPYPVYAMISAVVVTDLDSAETRKLGPPRVFGTVLGASLGAVISSVLAPGAWEAGVGILAAMLSAYALRVPSAAKLAGYVCGIVLLNFGDQAWHHALYRSLETAVGIGAAMLVSWFPKLLPDESLNRAVPAK